MAEHELAKEVVAACRIQGGYHVCSRGEAFRLALAVLALEAQIEEYQANGCPEVEQLQAKIDNLRESCEIRGVALERAEKHAERLRAALEEIRDAITARYTDSVMDQQLLRTIGIAARALKPAGSEVKDG